MPINISPHSANCIYRQRYSYRCLWGELHWANFFSHPRLPCKTPVDTFVSVTMWFSQAGLRELWLRQEKNHSRCSEWKKHLLQPWVMAGSGHQRYVWSANREVNSQDDDKCPLLSSELHVELYTCTQTHTHTHTEFRLLKLKSVMFSHSDRKWSHWLNEYIESNTYLHTTGRLKQQADKVCILAARPRTAAVWPHNHSRRENNIKNLVGPDKAREIAHQLLSQAEQTRLGENWFVAN